MHPRPRLDLPTSLVSPSFLLNATPQSPHFQSNSSIPYSNVASVRPWPRPYQKLAILLSFSLLFRFGLLLHSCCYIAGRNFLLMRWSPRFLQFWEGEAHLLDLHLIYIWELNMLFFLLENTLSFDLWMLQSLLDFLTWAVDFLALWRLATVSHLYLAVILRKDGHHLQSCLQFLLWCLVFIADFLENYVVVLYLLWFDPFVDCFLHFVFGGGWVPILRCTYYITVYSSLVKVLTNVKLRGLRFILFSCRLAHPVLNLSLFNPWLRQSQWDLLSIAIDLDHRGRLHRMREHFVEVLLSGGDDVVGVTEFDI